MSLPAAFALFAVLASGPMTPTASMYPVAEIVAALPAKAWCSEWSQMTFKAGGSVEIKDISGLRVGGPADKAGETMTGKWSMQDAKVHVVEPGKPQLVVDMVALRDGAYGMVLGYSQEYWAPCE